MSFAPYQIDSGFSHVESSHCVESYPLAQPAPASSDLPFDPTLYQSAPLQPMLTEGPWVDPDHSSWEYRPNRAPAWDALSQPFASPSSTNPSSDLFAYTQSLMYDANPDYEAYSPPSTTASDLELPLPFDLACCGTHSGLTNTPVVPSSNRETPLVHARLRTRRPSKESTKAVVDDRKYTCDFCPVQMARLHDINRHMRIHTGIHPYACAGCGETFRRTDARTRHWCKQPECFKIHNTKAPISKARRRIPAS